MMDFESFIMLDDSLALKSLSEPFSIDSNCFHPLYIYTHDLKLFRGLMCCRSRNSCSRPRLSLVSWCRACGPIFGVLLVPFIALVPRFPWPSRSSFWAFFVVVVCVLGSCSGDIVPLHSSTLHPAASAPSVAPVVNPRAALLGHLHGPQRRRP